MYAMLRAEDPDALADMSEPTPTPDSPAMATQEPLGMLATLPIMAADRAPDEHKIYQKLLATGTVSDQLAGLVNELILGIKVDSAPESKTNGRRRRGELEANVEVVCRMWLDGKVPWPELTTDVIGLMIDADDTISQGAIYAVLTRWADARLAEVGKKPMRFLSFSQAVLADGIAAVKSRASRDAEQRAKGFF
jgi:hypothetical protein